MKLFVSCFLLLLCLALSASAIPVEEMAAQPSVLDLVTPVVATASNSASGAAFAEESEHQIENKNAVATASTSAAGEAFPDASKLQVEDSSSSSANAALDPPANWNGWKWTPVQIGGPPTNNNILAACTAKGLKTPCDNPAYNDGKCVTVFSAHLSYPPQNGNNKILFNKFFYCGTGNGASSLYNDGSSHRWSTSSDSDGVTLCVSFSAESNTWNGWKWIPVQIGGPPTNKNILAACTAKGLKTPCDNPAYNDGKCVTVFSAHLSYPPQNGNNKILFNKFFYTNNGAHSLYNDGSSHRWSSSSDSYGVTLCVRQSQSTTSYMPISKEFAQLKGKIQSSLETMLADSSAECEYMTKQRDAAKVIFDSKSNTASAADKAFATSFAVKSVEDSSCTQNTNDATAFLATRNAANSELSKRNPVIQKELDVLDQLVSLIGTLKSINLQVDVDVDARASASQSLHESVMLLQSMNDEAGPLAEMVELAREHQEFTKPILDLLNQLKAKLLKERETLRTAATRESDAYNAAAEKATKSCASKDAKTAEMNAAKANLAAAMASKNAAEKEYKEVQALWVTATAECDAIQKQVTDETRYLKMLETCSLQAQKPFKNCYEILADNAKAASGVYKIDPSGSGTASQSVYCDMTTNGGGWTLLSSHDSAGGYFDTKTALSTGSVGADGPTSLYSILGLVDSFKRDGKFEFRYNTKATKSGPTDTFVTASQTSSPLDSGRIGGCAADWKVLASNYEVGSSQKLFCGWTPGPSGWAAINGYGPNWTHAIGQFKVYSDWPLVCTYNTNYFCSKVQFWVR